jgi:predicted esterase
VLLAGFSQGGGMAIQAALSEKFGARGFIGVGTFIAEPASLIPLVKHSPSVRGYFVVGEKDHTLDKVRAIQHILKENSIPFAEEVHPDLAHEFPADFGSSFEKAINFIFKERPTDYRPMISNPQNRAFMDVGIKNTSNPRTIQQAD